jgi:drug/metabolite transporter (DMT)-like permease
MNPTLRNWATLLLIGLIWGSSFILMKKGLVFFTDVQVGALRIGLAWLVTMPFLIQKISIVKRKEWLLLLVSGLFGNGIPAFLFTAAQRHLDSSLVGMLNSLVPVLTVLIGMVVFRLKVTSWQIAGLTVGLAGALMLILSDGLAEFKWPALLVVAASTCYAINLNVVRRYMQTMPTMVITAGAFLWVGPPCVFYLILSDMSERLEADGAWLALSGIVLLAVVGTAIAVLIFNRLIQQAGPVFASMVTYVVPLFALMWGMLDGERPSLLQLVGASVVLGGVYIVNAGKKTDSR